MNIVLSNIFKIVVLDNVANKKLEKRTFTITKEKNKVNVNKCWNEVCKIFDAFISLDSLASFYSYETKVDIITIKSTTGKDFAKKDNDIKIDSTNTGAKFVEMGAIQPDPYSRGLEHQRPYDEKFVNIVHFVMQTFAICTILSFFRPSMIFFYPFCLSVSFLFLSLHII